MGKNELTHIRVELSDEAAEVVVFEESWDEIHGERMSIPNDKAATGTTP